ncbi:MAG: hypothetical protein H6996_00075 [Moraxellaceae bacterium]|nr:hypothetical protein [Moraxellaceae bacterium]
MERITASATELMRQASMTAHDYMLEAVRRIDEVFGEGYAKTHPELVGDFMKTSAIDFATACISVSLQDIAENM